MKTVKIIRVERSEDGIIGVLKIDGRAQCWTLQPDDKDTHFSIPSGSYPCQRFHGKKYPDTFEIIVSGHSALLFHPLNIEDESEGCIGLGEYLGAYKGKRAIFNTVRHKAFDDFMKVMGEDQKFNLFIEDVF